MFTPSNSVYKDKLGPRPIDDEIFTREEVKKVFSTGNSNKDIGNRFTGHATAAVSFQQVRRLLVEDWNENRVLPLRVRQQIGRTTLRD